jgi:tetratricopeptide (TPR) repeat protein
MAIKGSLKEASLGDVCQLLALGLKTGCLSITDRSRFGQIFFERGRINYAHVVNRRDRLGDLLVRDGLMAQDQLDAELRQQSLDPDKRLGELLVERGLITTADLTRYVQQQIEEAVFHLFTWSRGNFFFEPDDRPDALDIVVSINPETLLLEAARRVDEWSLIERKIPSLDLLFEVERGRLEGAALDLTEEQVRIVPLLDGSRTVQDIADVAGFEEFEVGKALYGLIQAGFAHRVGVRNRSDEPRTTDGEIAERRNLGTAFFRTHLFEQARAEFERVLALNRHDLVARFHLGLIAAHEQRYRESVRHFMAVLEEGGPRFAAFACLAYVLRGLGRQADALLALDEAEALRPGHAEVALARGVNRLDRLELTAAEAEFEEYARRLPDHRVPGRLYFHYLALCRALGSDLRGAQAITEEGLAVHPDAAPLLVMMGLISERRGDYDAAERWYRRAAEEDPRLPQVHRNLGDICYRRSRHGEALAHYRHALEIDPALGDEIHARVGNILFKTGDRAGAVAQWNRALELNPGNEVVRSNLRVVAHAAG